MAAITVHTTELFKTEALAPVPKQRSTDISKPTVAKLKDPHSF